MTPRPHRFLPLLVLLTGLVASPAAAVGATEPQDVPDTTAPQVRLNPCVQEETTCRLVYAEVWGSLEPGDDLAVLGARIGDDVLEEQVYDDGTGFVPYGSFNYGDVIQEVDYALSVEVPRGSSDITFYARDLSGNTRELTTTVLGPVPPGRVQDVRARRAGPGVAVLRWSGADTRGLYAVGFTVSSPGLRDRTCATAVPMGPCFGFTYRRLSTGWHRFTVRAFTAGGTGRPTSTRVWIPRRRDRL